MKKAKKKKMNGIPVSRFVTAMKLIMHDHNVEWEKGSKDWIIKDLASTLIAVMSFCTGRDTFKAFIIPDICAVDKLVLCKDYIPQKVGEDENGEVWCLGYVRVQSPQGVRKGAIVADKANIPTPEHIEAFVDVYRQYLGDTAKVTFTESDMSEENLCCALSMTPDSFSEAYQKEKTAPRSYRKYSFHC